MRPVRVLVQPLSFSRPSALVRSSGTARSISTLNLQERESWDEVYIDAEADMLLAEASSAICVQRLDDSRNSAIHTTYRISLRSSSLREPRYPLLRVVLVLREGRPGRLHSCFSCFCLVWLVDKGADRSRGTDLRPALSTPVRGRERARPTPGRARCQARSERPTLIGSQGVVVDRFNDPSAGSPTETLLRLLLPLGGRV